MSSLSRLEFFSSVIKIVTVCGLFQLQGVPGGEFVVYRFQCVSGWAYPLSCHLCWKVVSKYPNITSLIKGE